MKRIYIDESAIHLIKESEKHIVYKDVFDNLKSFLKELLDNPSSAKVNSFFTSHGFNTDDILKKLKKLGIVSAKENIIEVPIDEAKKNEVKGKQRAKHTIQYFLNRKRFIDKVDHLCKELLSSINEDFEPKAVFVNTPKIIKAIKGMDYDGAYATRGGYRDSLHEINDIYNTNLTNDDRCPYLDKVFGNGFTLREMLQYDSLVDRIDYAEEHLEELGCGRRRIVFSLDDRLVLKLSQGNHRFQSKNEYDAAMFMSGRMDLFPRIIYQAHDFSWTIMEKVEPLTNEDCLDLLGVPYSSYDGPSLCGFQEWAETKAREEMRTNPQDDVMYKNLMKANPWFKSFFQLENSQRNDRVYGTDFRIENLGVANRNGKRMVVFSDFGFIKPWDTRKLQAKHGEQSPQIQGHFNDNMTHYR